MVNGGTNLVTPYVRCVSLISAACLSVCVRVRASGCVSFSLCLILRALLSRKFWPRICACECYPSSPLSCWQTQASSCTCVRAFSCVRVYLFVFARARMQLFSLVSGLKWSHTSWLVSYRCELGSRNSTEPGFEVRSKTSSEFQPNFLIFDIFSKLGIF